MEIEELTEEDRGMLIALTLGDGYVTPKKITGNSQLCIKHGIKQKSYCEEKRNIASNIFKKPINICEHKERNHICINFRIRHSCLNDIRNLMYPDGKKAITKEILNSLSDQGIAIWFMDDGSLSGRKNGNNKYTSFGIEISTYCSKNEAEIVREFFLNRYGIEMKLHYDKRCSEGHQYHVYCSTTQTRKLIPILAPYCMTGMEYKFDMERFGLGDKNPPNIPCTVPKAKVTLEFAEEGV